LALELDGVSNATGDPLITAAGSGVRAWVIPTNEELMIARHMQRVVAK
jgi:acetate kinase